MRKCLECSYEQNTEDNNPCPRCGGKNFSFSNNNPKVTQRSESNDVVFDQSRKTIAGKQASISSEVLNTCPKCKYILVSSSDSCPNCGFENFKDKNSSTLNNHKKTVRISDFESIETGKTKSIELIPMSEKGNNILFKISTQDTHQIKRNDIDEKDESISNTYHAQFMMKGDKLIIKNLASNQALFKLIKDEVELENDDVVLIGKNKFFKVKIN